MPSAITDLLTKTSAGTRPSPTTLASPKAVAAASISCATLTTWNITTAVHFIIYNVDANGLKVAGSQTDWKGLVSGSTITNLVLKAGTDNGYGIGAVVEAAPTAQWADDLMTALIASMNQDGSLKTAAVQAALNTSGAGTDGWTALATPPNSVTALGNRSYTVSIPGVDYTDRLSVGDRLKLTRTVAAPSKCTLLNGTTQFYSKTSPNKLTFTNNFVTSGWVKLTSYANFKVIVSRYNGTNGWELGVNTSGQVYLTGYNGASGNQSSVTSYQSLPLNKWIHVASQLDMLTFTATTTTSYVMFDGVDVPASVARAGTNPTALVQAGNLEIGSSNAGTNLFPGKIAQVAIYSAKVTQATIPTSINQGLVGTETSLASAYSFNNSLLDLNTTTPNDLTANGAAVATNADSPFAQGVTAGLIEYGIITAASFSANTALTVQVPEGSAIPTTGGITSASYSGVKVPYGFPAQRGKWQVEYLQKAQVSVAGTASVWTTVGNQLNIPIGEWDLGYDGYFIIGTGGTAFLNVCSTLSTSPTAETDPRFSARTPNPSPATAQESAQMSRRNPISLSVATVYYLPLLPSASSSTVYWDGSSGMVIIRAELAHL